MVAIDVEFHKKLNKENFTLSSIHFHISHFSSFLIQTLLNMQLKSLSLKNNTADEYIFVMNTRMKFLQNVQNSFDDG